MSCRQCASPVTAARRRSRRIRYHAGWNPRTHSHAARQPQAQRACRRRGQDDHVLHVRVPVRHQSAPQGRPRTLHPGQPRASGQQGRAVRERFGRDHAALLAGAPAQAAAARGRARRRRIQGDRMGRSARHRDALARRHPCNRPGQARVLHRPRPVAGADQLVGAAIRYGQLRRAWRLLLGQHGRGRHVHARRLVLGIRRAGLGAFEVPADVRRRRGSRLQSDQAGPGQAQGTRREDRCDQSGAHRLCGDRRRMDRHPPRQRRPVRRRADPRAAAARRDRLRLSGQVYECASSGRAQSGRCGRRVDRARCAGQSAVCRTINNCESSSRRKPGSSISAHRSRGAGFRLSPE